MNSEERIRRALHERASAIQSVDPDLEGRVHSRVARRRRRRLGAGVVAGTAVVALVAVAVGTVIVSGDDSSGVRTPAPDEVSPSGVTELPAGPKSHAYSPWVVATDDEIVVWGGSDRTGDEYEVSREGAVFDPATGEWQTMAPAPFDTPIEVDEYGESLFRQAAVSTGEEIVVMDGFDVAAWDPSSDTWRQFPDMPGTGEPLVAERQAFLLDRLVATDDEVIATAVWAALDPDEGTWRTLTPPPFEMYPAPRAIWADGELLLIGHPLDEATEAALLQGGSVTMTPSPLSVLAYDPDSDSWSEATPTPFTSADPYAFASVAWADDQLVVVTSSLNEDSEVAAYDPASGVWIELPTLPPLPSDGGWGPMAAMFGERVGMVTPNAFAILDGDDWVMVPNDDIPPNQANPIASIVAVDGVTYVYADSYQSEGVPSDDASSRFFALDVERMLGTRSVSLGDVTVYPPVGYEIGPASYIDDDPNMGIEVVLTGPNACTVTSSRMFAARGGAPVGAPPQGELVEIEPNDGSASFTMTRAVGEGSPPQYVVGALYLAPPWVDGTSNPGWLVVDCEDPDRAIEVARGLVLSRAMRDAL